EQIDQDVIRDYDTAGEVRTRWSLRESDVQALVEAMSGYGQPQEINPPEELLPVINAAWELI
ncbi:MAG: hypothetical protein LBD06_13240, partial [Candidatus Accumulibacter sp.]|nr:hypothetical protein [Accumulibacter sp.]